MTTADEAIKILSSVKDSGSGKSLIELGWLGNIRVVPPRAIVSLSLPNFAQNQRDRLAQEIRTVLEKLQDINEVQIELASSSDSGSIGNAGHGELKGLQVIEGVRNVIAVTSGKGGVGKSTVAVNIACSLAKKGLKVGLLDADIYGPNTPIMLGVDDQLPNVSGTGEDQKITPIDSYGISLVSMGFLIDQDQPVIWRGPMLNGIIRQFLYQTSWGERDFLIVDMPPGTGDAQLSLAQAVPLTGVLIVTTPQKVSLQDSRRGLAMFKQMGIPILGVVENMSFFIPPDMPHLKYELFGKGGGKQLASEYSVPLLAQLPMELNVVDGGNKGWPVVDKFPESATSKSFQDLANLMIENFAINF